MTIYIEIFLLQNFLINFCLLRLVYLTIKPKSSIFRLILASLIGSIFSVISAIFIRENNVINILKIICSVSMIYVAFYSKKLNIKQLFFEFILLFIYTYSFGGAVIAFSGSCYQTSFGVITSSKINLSMVCIIVIILTYIFELVANVIKNKIKISKYIYKTELTLNNKTISINAYLDTGNLLTHDGQPVVIVDLDTYLNLSNTNLIDFYLNKLETANIGTVLCKSNLKVIKIDKITIKTGQKKVEILSPYIAISTNKFASGNYSALLSPMLL